MDSGGDVRTLKVEPITNPVLSPGIEPPTKPKTSLPATLENLKALEDQREKATSAGIKALTRRINAMKLELDS